MWPSLENKLGRFQEIELLLGDPAVVTDINRYGALAREHGALSKVVKPYLEFKKLADDVGQAEAMLAAEKDAEMRSYAAEELASLQVRQAALKTRLEDMLLVDPSEDFSGIIMEIRAG